MDQCLLACNSDGSNCVNDCADDTYCKSQCSRNHAVCTETCPCLSGCYNGCEDCLNPICYCQDYQTDSDYKDCKFEVQDNLFECLLQCDNMENIEVNQCEFDCIMSTKIEYAKCPCQVKAIKNS